MFDQYYLNKDGEKVYFHEEHGMRFEWMKTEDIVFTGSYDSPSRLLMRCILVEPARTILGFGIVRSGEFCGHHTYLYYLDDEGVIRTNTTVDKIIQKNKFTKRGYIDYTNKNYLYLISKRVPRDFFYDNKILGLVEPTSKIDVHSKLIIKHKCGHININCSINNYMKNRTCGVKECKGKRIGESQMSDYNMNTLKCQNMFPFLKFKPNQNNISMHTPTRIWCSLCKVWFYKDFDSILFGKCAHNYCHTKYPSAGAWVVKNVIDKMHNWSESEKMFKELGTMRYDRFCNVNNIIFEYDGKQHFDENNWWYSEEGVERDRIKTEYAVNNGYNFIRIAYYEDHVKALESFLALVLKHQDKQIVQIYGEVQILDK